MSNNNELARKPNKNARLVTFGSYKAVWDVEHIAGFVYRGRPLMEKIMMQMPGAAARSQEFDWIYFIEEYDDRNDWDRLYHSIKFDSSLFDVPFMVIPKEKILFAYSPSPELIELPSPTIQFGRK